AQLCGAYFSEELNKVRTIFSNDYTEHFKKIKSIQDPILRYVALYLVHNYDKSKKYFIENGRRENNIACLSLNRWLDQRKSFYTHGDKCAVNLDLWKQTIDPIWEMLNKNQTLNCMRKEIYTKNTYIPNALLPPTCYKYVPLNYTCTYPLHILNKYKNLLSTECKKIDSQCSKCEKI
ncbi:hypothetical protein PCYB_006010, partial [Plasmodium cynomolgi strain B]